MRTVERREFWKSLKEELFGFVREVAAPLAEEYAERLEEVSEAVEGVLWFPVRVRNLEPGEAELVFAGNDAFFVVKDRDGNERALRNRCPTCGGLLTHIPYARALRCLRCRTEYRILDNGGTLAPLWVRFRRDDEGARIGVKVDEP